MSWFKLPPVVYCALGALAAIIGAFMFFSDRSAEQEKAQALAGKPPVAVEIDKFDLARNVGASGEVNVLGQVDTAKMVDVTETENGKVVRRWFVAPLYPVNSPKPEGPAIGAIIQDGAISDQQLMKFIVSEGPFGPVMRLNGVVNGDTAKAMGQAAERGVVVGANPVFVDPFENGRAAAFAPSSGGQESAFLVLIAGLLVAGYGLLRWFFIARENRAIDAMEPAQ